MHIAGAVMAFNRLPIELNQTIASFLESDRDIEAFRGVCRSTWEAIEEDNWSFWRRRFHQVFEPLKQPQKELVNNQKFRFTYLQRKHYLHHELRFKNGSSVNEKTCLRVMRDIINECRFGNSSDDQTSLNMRHIEVFVHSSNILADMLKPQQWDAQDDKLLIAIQLVLAHASVSLDPSGGPRFKMWDFVTSQKIVYDAVKTRPLFYGPTRQQVDLSWARHCLNFFKYHLTTESEHTLWDHYVEMEPEALPKRWNSQLCNGAGGLGSTWLGTYAYIEREEIEEMRHQPAGTSTILDKNVDNEEAFQTLELDFSCGTSDLPWPATFESALHSVEPPPSARYSTRAQHRNLDGVFRDCRDYRRDSIQLVGGGYDDGTYHSIGWLNPLPAQQGIMGWQRVTMMKYFLCDEDGTLDTESLWCYEGVVLPSRQMMLGRWWCPKEDARTSANLYSGPFIFWNIDGSDRASADDKMSEWRAEFKQAMIALSIG